MLFDFSAPSAVERFAPIDDRVMGGVSRSALRSVGDKAAFEGELSTERNGGFASVRSNPGPIDLSGMAGIALHACGDGRTYKVSLRTDSTFDGVSYQASFATTAGTWGTIYLPFATFRPTRRGRVLSDAAPFEPAKLMSLGLLVAAGQVGSFRLEISWIRAFDGR